MKDLLAGKVVLISGGTRVSVPASPGRRPRRRHLVVAGRNAGHGEQVAAELAAGGAEASYVQADITDVAQAVAAVRDDGEAARADRLTGQLRRTDHPRHPAGHHRGTVRPALAVNLKAPFFLMQAAVADMIEAAPRDRSST